MPLRSVPIVRAPDGNTEKALMTVQMTSMTLSDGGKAGGSIFHILPPDSVTYTLLITGMRYVGLPQDMAKAVHAAAGVLQDDSLTGGTPYAACNLSRADSTFTFGFGGEGGPVIRVPVRDFVYGQEDNVTFADGSPACMFDMGETEGQMAILGDRFLRSAYAVFDHENHQVALAQARDSKNQTDCDIKPIANGTDGIPGVAARVSSIPYPQSYVDEYSAYQASANATATTTAASGSRTGSPTGSATDTDTEAPWIAYPTVTSRIMKVPPKALFTGLSVYERG